MVAAAKHFLSHPLRKINGSSGDIVRGDEVITNQQAKILHNQGREKWVSTDTQVLRHIRTTHRSRRREQGEHTLLGARVGPG